MDYEVWAEGFPDAPGFSARITRVEPDVPDECGHSGVGAMTCVPYRWKGTMGRMVEDLFRVFINVPDGDGVTVHLTWLDEPPPDLLE